MLATGVIRAEDGQNRIHYLTVMFDKGSEVNLISKKCVKVLGLTKKTKRVQLMGLTGEEISDGIADLQFSPWFESKRAETMNRSFIVVENVPTLRDRCVPKNVVEFKNLQLADPKFHMDRKLDALLGVEVWSKIVEPHIVKSKTGLIAQKTSFGYAVCGAIRNAEIKSLHKLNVNCNVIRDDEASYKRADEMLRKLWELEDETIYGPEMTVANARAEEIFKQTTRKTADGRYVVRIPFVSDTVELGNSREFALKRYFELERRLKRTGAREKYDEFMQQYIALGHMRLATEAERNISGYYIPQHVVLKRYRVVFDGSAVTTNGVSVNDVQLQGPNLQDKLLYILMRFRMGRYVLTTDVKKMFRQILIDPRDVIYQKVFYRENENETVQTYVLLTVTYGFKSSPYLSVRTMLTIADDYQSEYPLAAESIRKNRYVDDITAGADTPGELMMLYHQLKGITAEAQMELSKWRTNEIHLTELMENELELTDQDLMFKEEGTSVLGMLWSPGHDIFKFHIRPEWDPKRAVTKKTIVGAAGEIFDPLGLISPVALMSKVFIQELWKDGVDWDDRLNPELTLKWTKYYGGLPELNKLRIPRWVQISKESRMELHGFADASEIGYGAAVYITTEIENGRVSHLLTAKGRVAPVRTLTIPRLELCAAELLAKLIHDVKNACGFENAPMTLYSDSTVVLSWIKKSPMDLKTYAANRVQRIQDLVGINVWKYVSTNDNPADIISRGMDPIELMKCKLWWHGPNFITNSTQKPHNEPSITLNQIAQIRAEAKPYIVNQLVITRPDCLNVHGEPLIERTNSLKKLLTTTALIKQLTERLRRRYKADENTMGAIKLEAKIWALKYWIKYEQKKHFYRDIRKMEVGSELDKASNIANLCPFIDSDGIVRCHGRLRNANIPYDEQNPIIVPSRSRLAKMLLDEAHEETAHGNIQIMLHYVRARYWIIGGRKCAGNVVKRCVRCTTFAKRAVEQLMGDVPKERLTSIGPFYYCGVDYFGPITIRRNEGRCNVTQQGYGAVFICLTTKVIHIDCVSDMTSEKFLWSLSRLTSIYRTPTKMFSDNGRTFVGADNELKVINETWQTPEVERFLTMRGIQWKFITPRAPHQGGIWEAAVKSAKYHLKRVLTQQSLTFEQYSTVFAKVSAVLNSRPLVPLTDNPTDLNYLTPAHAVRGERIIQPLGTNLSGIPLTRVRQHKIMEKLHQDFWQTWRRDYLNTLQNRKKWSTQRENLKEDDFVLMKEDNLPPGVWLMARVIETYPGADGLVRNVMVRTYKNDYLRPVQKLVKLPLQEQENEQMTEIGQPGTTNEV